MTLFLIPQPDRRDEHERRIVKDPFPESEIDPMLGQIGRALCGVELEDHICDLHIPVKTPPPHMLRAISIFMISFDPPKIRVTRLSRNILAMGYSLM